MLYHHPKVNEVLNTVCDVHLEREEKTIQKRTTKQKLHRTKQNKNLKNSIKKNAMNTMIAEWLKIHDGNYAEAKPWLEREEINYHIRVIRNHKLWGGKYIQRKSKEKHHLSCIISSEPEVTLS